VSLVQSLPYLWPYHGAVKPRQTALLVCNDGAVAVDAAPLERLRRVIAAARRAGVRIVHSPHTGLEPLLAREPGDLVIERPAYGGFTGTSMDMVLRAAGLTDLLLAGFPAELGADSAMREANDLGYECLLLSDCCTGLSEDTLRGAVSSVQMSGGILGAVAGSDEVMAALGHV
jgi:nicotinamidase-related amidase